MTSDQFHPSQSYTQLLASGLNGADLVAKFDDAPEAGLPLLAAVAIAKVLELERDLTVATQAAGRSRALPVYDPEDLAMAAPPARPRRRRQWAVSHLKGGATVTRLPVNRQPRDGAA